MLLDKYSYLKSSFENYFWNFFFFFVLLNVFSDSFPIHKTSYKIYKTNCILTMFIKQNFNLMTPNN